MSYTAPTGEAAPGVLLLTGPCSHQGASQPCAAGAPSAVQCRVAAEPGEAGGPGLPTGCAEAEATLVLAVCIACQATGTVQTHFRLSSATDQEDDRCLSGGRGCSGGAGQRDCCHCHSGIAEDSGGSGERSLSICDNLCGEILNQTCQCVGCGHCVHLQTEEAGWVRSLGAIAWCTQAPGAALPVTCRLQ